MALKNNVNIIVNDGQIKVFINNQLHLCLRQSELIAVQSWLNGYSPRRYYIEYTMNKREVLTGYDDKQIWKSVLKELNKHNLFAGEF